MGSALGVATDEATAFGVPEELACFIAAAAAEAMAAAASAATAAALVALTTGVLLDEAAPAVDTSMVFPATAPRSSRRGAGNTPGVGRATLAAVAFTAAALTALFAQFAPTWSIGEASDTCSIRMLGAKRIALGCEADAEGTPCVGGAAVVCGTCAGATAATRSNGMKDVEGTVLDPG